MTNPTDLKNIGLKATLPRLKILEIFQHSPVRHLTAEDVYRAYVENRVTLEERNQALERMGESIY